MITTNINLNNKVTIYPTPKGWEVAKKLLTQYYSPYQEAVEILLSVSKCSSIEEFVEKDIKEHMTPDGGFKDNAHNIIKKLHGLYLGNNLLQKPGIWEMDIEI